MPGAMRYVPPSDRWRASLTPALLTEKTQRHRQYVNALKYYKGEHVEQLTYDPDNEPNDNVAINLVKTAADRTAQFLFPEMPGFETDPNTPDETEEEKYIKAFFDTNGGLPFLIKTATRGFLSGHNFVRVKPRRVWEDYPKLVLLDPLSVTVWWRADDVGDILWYEFRYAVGNSVWLQDFVNDPVNRRWLIYTYRGDNGRDDNMPIPVDDILIGVPGPYGTGYAPPRMLTSLFDSNLSFKLVPRQVIDDDDLAAGSEGFEFGIHTSIIPPIIEWAHLPDPDNYYGQSEASNLNLQDTINRIWSEINRIVREHSDPLDVVVGADVDDIVPYGDNLLTIGTAQAKAQRLEFKGDLEAAVNTVNKLTETFLSIVRVVILRGEAKDLQRVTNASVRTLFVDMLAKNAQLQAAYGGAIVKMARLAMQMSGKSFAGGAMETPVNLQWASPLPTDLTEIANINALALNGGYRSKRTAATQLGDDWTQEKAEIETETDEAMQRQEAQMELMAKFQPEPASSGEGGNKPGTNPKAGSKPVAGT